MKGLVFALIVINTIAVISVIGVTPPNIFALSHEPMVCTQYNSDGSCKVSMRQSDWQQATDRQYDQQVALTLATIIIIPTVIITLIVIIIVGVKKSRKNKSKKL